MENTDRDALIELLATLQRAMRDDDEALFAKLWDSASEPDLGSFKDNGQKLRDQSWRLRAEAMNLMGDRAELRFVIIDSQDQEIDRAIVQLVKEQQQWKLAGF